MTDQELRELYVTMAAGDEDAMLEGSQRGLAEYVASKKNELKNSIEKINHATKADALRTKGREQTTD